MNTMHSIKYYGKIIRISAPDNRTARMLVAQDHPTTLQTHTLDYSGTPEKIKIGGRYTQNPAQISSFAKLKSNPVKWNT